MRTDIDHAAVELAVRPFLHALSDELLPVSSLAKAWADLDIVKRWALGRVLMKRVAPNCSAHTVANAVLELDDAVKARLDAEKAERVRRGLEDDVEEA